MIYYIEIRKKLEAHEKRKLGRATLLKKKRKTENCKVKERKERGRKTVHKRAARKIIGIR